MNDDTRTAQTTYPPPIDPDPVDIFNDPPGKTGQSPAFFPPLPSADLRRGLEQVRLAHEGTYLSRNLVEDAEGGTLVPDADVLYVGCAVGALLVGAVMGGATLPTFDPADAEDDEYRTPIQWVIDGYTGRMWDLLNARYGRLTRITVPPDETGETGYAEATSFSLTSGIEHVFEGRNYTAEQLLTLLEGQGL